ncbi:hypothetical protein DXG01_009179, partial [Tephrocybe rancida]
DSGGQGANVLIVPRVERFVNRTKGKGRAGRPSKLLLEVKEAIRLFGADAVKVHNPPTNFTYLGNWYHNGFLYHVTHNVEPAVPTVEELALFQDCAAAEDIVCAQNQIASLRLKLEDRVIVTLGELLGMTGTITSISEEANKATVSIDAKEGIMDVVVPPIHLRKSVRVKDRVCVAGGAGDGRVGWVVAGDGTELHVLEDKTAQPFKININRVTIHLDAQMFSRVASKPELSNLSDTQLKPLMYKFHAETFRLADMPPPAKAVIPRSILPLTPSTPIPTGSSVEIAAAWNPSSRTLNPNRKFPCNPYMEHWHMDRNLRVKVRLHNTKPMLRDPGWRSGDFENGTGIWKATDTDEAGYAKVQLTQPLVIMLCVPEIYVTPVRPTRPQEYVIVNNDNSLLCCRVYLVLCVHVSVDGPFCDLREKGSKDKKDFITLSTNILAVVVF